MKKTLGIAVLMAQAVVSSGIQADSCDCTVTSHTFFSARPLYQSASPERVSLFHRPMVKEGGHGGAMQFVLFGGKTRRNDDLAKFFTPFCKTKLLILEDERIADADLIAHNFNIFTKAQGAEDQATFESTITIEPRQNVFGLGFTYRQNLSQLFWDDADCEYPWWFEISTPLTRIENRVDLGEAIEHDGGGAAQVTGLPEEQVLFDSMKAAFNQKLWKYGKINDGNKMKKTRLADIELKLGYQWVNTECCGAESYIGLHIPTGNRPHAEYLFEPIVGANQHWGVMWGTSAYFDVWQNDCVAFNFYIDLAAKYMFSGRERRSFDLKYKPWSRYLSVYESFEQATLANANADTFGIQLASPGINFFTQDLKVKPGFSHTINSAIELVSECFNLELGLNVFARQAECVRLRESFPTGIAIRSSEGQGKTNIYKTINEDFAELDVVYGQSNYESTAITESDIDLNSAAHPAMITHTLYGALGYKFEDCCCYPMFIGLGGSYEMSRDNAGMHRWTLWGKFGFSF
ncbi:hypothetical protein KJZ61_01350 [Candidatus Dependentiae bacterium]|nr:hypothetical protein [Candidatus Dependentiae bacterium]